MPTRPAVRLVERSVWDHRRGVLSPFVTTKTGGFPRFPKKSWVILSLTPHFLSRSAKLTYCVLSCLVKWSASAELGDRNGACVCARSSKWMICQNGESLRTKKHIEKIVKHHQDDSALVDFLLPTGMWNLCRPDLRQVLSGRSGFRMLHLLGQAFTADNNYDNYGLNSGAALVQTRAVPCGKNSCCPVLGAGHPCSWC